MNLRIAYYVVAFAISLAAFAGAYGYASPSAAAFNEASVFQVGDAYKTTEAKANAAYVTAYGMAAAVSLAAFAGAFILDKKAA